MSGILNLSRKLTPSRWPLPLPDLHLNPQMSPSDVQMASSQIQVCWGVGGGVEKGAEKPEMKGDVNVSICFYLSLYDHSPEIL